MRGCTYHFLIEVTISFSLINISGPLLPLSQMGAFAFASTAILLPLSSQLNLFTHITSYFDKRAGIRTSVSLF